MGDGVIVSGVTNYLRHKQKTPIIAINYGEETLKGFVSRGSYLIDGQAVEPKDGVLAIGSYMGKTVSIVRAAEWDADVSSNPLMLKIPARPAAPSEVQGVKNSAFGVNDGKIVGVSEAMEYKRSSDDAWTACTGAEITGLEPGTYQVRLKAASNAFVGEPVEVTVEGVLPSITIQTSEGGTAEASLEEAAEGTEITLTATEEAGYLFKEWKVVAGNVTIRDDRFTMPAENVIIKAVFEEIRYTVTLQASGGGGASASAAETEEGKEVVLTAKPSKGYRLKEWQVTPASVTVRDNRFIMPAENVTVKAIFEKIAYKITIQSGAGGTATASAATAEMGTLITLTAKASTGFRFKGWQISPNTVRISSNRFTMPSEDVTIKAAFEKITTTGTGAGPGTGSGAVLTYSKGNLTSGDVSISGNQIHRNAKLLVQKDTLHAGEDCGCVQLRKLQEEGLVIGTYDVSMTENFRGTVILTLPVPEEYNGKTLILARCTKDGLEGLDVTATDGQIAVTVDSLALFAILEEIEVPETTAATEPTEVPTTEAEEETVNTEPTETTAPEETTEETTVETSTETETETQRPEEEGSRDLISGKNWKTIGFIVLLLALICGIVVGAYKRSEEELDDETDESDESDEL